MPSPYATPVPKPVKHQNKRNKDWGKQVERDIAAKLTALGMPARRVPFSGAIKNAGLNGDVDADWFLAEVKARTPEESKAGKTITLSLAIWEKARDEAAQQGKPAVLIVHPKGKHYQLVICDFDTLMGLLGRARQALKA